VEREDVMAKINQAFAESKSLRRINLKGLGEIGCAFNEIRLIISDLKLVNSKSQLNMPIGCGRNHQRLEYFGYMRRSLHVLNKVIDLLFTWPNFQARTSQRQTY
jgi:hypothetical protein